MAVPGQSVFDQNKPFMCGSCGGWGAPDPNRPGCNTGCTHKNGDAAATLIPTATQLPNPNAQPSTIRTNPMYQTQALGPNPFNQSRVDCASIGAPYPCAVTMTPDGSKVLGSAVPLQQCGCNTFEEAVRKMCFIGVSVLSGNIAGGGTAVVTVELKWWFQIQMILNLGDQTNPTFRLTNIRYGQSNYAPEFVHLQINSVEIPPASRGIDVRVWNITGLYPKFMPIPAAALNDPVELTFLNITADNQVLALHFGGPALLQIG